LICPVLLHGSETWEIVNGVYRSKNNFELEKQFNSQYHRRREERYAGLIIRGAIDLQQRTLFRVVPEGRGTEGRPKFKRADDVNSNSKA
jgi:hypothetical protein